MRSTIRNANIEDSDQECAGYYVYIAFGKDVTDLAENEQLKILDFPYSCCGCYDGRKVCSHQLAARGLVYLIQNKSKEDIEKVFLSMKSPVDVQNILTPIEYFGETLMKKKRRLYSRGSSCN